MKRILLALALCLASTGAFAQCNGTFKPGYVCGVGPLEAIQPPHAASASTFFPTASGPGGSTGQYQINKGGGAFGGVTFGGDASVTSAGTVTVTGTNGTAFGSFATSSNAANLTGTISPNRFNNGIGASVSTFLDGLGQWIWPSPSPTRCNLKTQMDSHYGVGGWVYRTSSTSLGTDTGPAESECIATFDLYRDRGVIYVPSTGTFEKSTGSLDASGVYYEGDGSQASQVVYNNSSSAAFLWTGASGVSGGGIRGLNIALEAGLTSSTSIAVLMQGTSSFQPGQMEMHDVYITALTSSTWGSGVVVDGSAKTTGAQGVRGVQFSDIQVFSVNNIGAEFNNCVQCSINNMGIYSGIGTGANFFIAGATGAGATTTQIWATNIIATQINVTNTTRAWVVGWGSSIAYDATVTHSLMYFQGTSSSTCGTSCTVTLF